MNHSGRNANSSGLKTAMMFSLTILIALVLVLQTLPPWLFHFWPDWIALVIIYWSLNVPERIGPFVALLVGIVVEVLFVRRFGILGLGFALLAFVVNWFHLQLRVLAPWQQAIMVGLLIAVFKLITGWLYGMVSGFHITTEYWYSILGSIMVWPFLHVLLREFKQAVSVS